jgi:hypothetical protein
MLQWMASLYRVTRSRQSSGQPQEAVHLLPITQRYVLSDTNRSIISLNLTLDATRRACDSARSLRCGQFVAVAIDSPFNRIRRLRSDARLHDRFARHANAGSRIVGRRMARWPASSIASEFEGPKKHPEMAPRRLSESVQLDSSFMMDHAAFARVIQNPVFQII